MSFSKTIIAGNLGQDPEVKTTNGGTVICNMTVAVNERVKEKGEWVDRVEWFRCVLFGKTAENAGKYLSKGRQVLIEGKMRTRKWEKDGKTNYMTELIADSVTFLGSKNGDSNQRDQQPREQRQGAPKSQPDSHSNPFNEGDGGGEEPAWDADDIPFCLLAAIGAGLLSAWWMLPAVSMFA
jgi:single-strand DNA-binding protein